MLAMSRDVGYILEPFHVRHRPGICAARFANWFQYVCEENEAEFAPALDRTLSFRYDVPAELRAVRGPRDVARMLRDWSRTVGYRLRGARPLVKDPIAFFSAPWLARRYDMEVIVLVRHPAAFTSSLKRLSWTFDFQNLARQPLLMRDLLARWEEPIQRAARQPPSIVGQAALLWNVIYDVAHDLRARHPEWKVLRHEDLSLDPEGGFRALFDSLGIEFTDPIRQLVIAMTSASNPAEAPAGRAHAMQRDSRANVRNWSKRLSAAEIAELRELVSPVAPRYYSDADW
jgi:hypothetical protein